LGGFPKGRAQIKLGDDFDASAAGGGKKGVAPTEGGVNDISGTEAGTEEAAADTEGVGPGGEAATDEQLGGSGGGEGPGLAAEPGGQAAAIEALEGAAKQGEVAEEGAGAGRTGIGAGVRVKGFEEAGLIKESRDSVLMAAAILDNKDARSHGRARSRR
jgi:hypothetical protein